MVSFEWDEDKRLSKVKTSRGTYEIWHALFLVDFIPKGKRKATVTMHVDYPRTRQAPSEGDMYRTIIRLMAQCEPS